MEVEALGHNALTWPIMIYLCIGKEAGIVWKSPGFRPTVFDSRETSLWCRTCCPKAVIGFKGTMQSSLILHPDQVNWRSLRGKHMDSINYIYHTLSFPFVRQNCYTSFFTHCFYTFFLHILLAQLETTFGGFRFVMTGYPLFSIQEHLIFPLGCTAWHPVRKVTSSGGASWGDQCWSSNYHHASIEIDLLEMGGLNMFEPSIHPSIHPSVFFFSHCFNKMSGVISMAQLQLKLGSVPVHIRWVQRVKKYANVTLWMEIQTWWPSLHLPPPKQLVAG